VSQVLVQVVNLRPLRQVNRHLFRRQCPLLDQAVHRLVSHLVIHPVSHLDSLLVHPRGIRLDNPVVSRQGYLVISQQLRHLQPPRIIFLPFWKR
jgi:hypothetical protein